MARLVVITHEFDDFVHWRLRPRPMRQARYLLFDVLRHFETLGHSWRLVRGPRPAKGDVALLHVDSTIVAPEYLELGAHYGLALNFGTGDTSKATISRMRVTPCDDWRGPVVVKSNLNYRGLVEKMQNDRAKRARRPLPHPALRSVGEYRLFDRSDEVPDDIWSDPGLIVERFTPEFDEDGRYVYRTWIFMGRRERCTRFLAPRWMVKASDVVAYEPMEVPAQLRAERERLNFDYGKFDFVMHDGVPIVFDVNRTPGLAKRVEALTKAGAHNLAEGLHELVTASRL
jgi:hypothetical protein